ncbi:MAG: cysteine--tRNA ligase [Acidobacteriota bacterium]|nr:cysteine--tRNA ligase [Acidobacteriota bacterium]
MFKFHNTLGGRLEPFEPLVPGRVGLYTCGPTVYDTPHVGNYRSYVFEDLLKRSLEYAGWRVMHVMNITDVDDKTIRSAHEKGLSLDAYTAPYIAEFKAGLRALRIEPADVYPRATEHIPEMTALIQGLLDKGVAYRKDGSIYFAIDKFPDYGKLSGIHPEDLRTTERIGARLESDEYEKDSARDFALWKAPKEGEASWDTPLGPGRPGWHIECSAMSAKYLGPSFDIHCGGIDNIFPHHENEIAQSEAFTGRPFVRYWLHGHHLIVDGEKMAKSKGNAYTLASLEARGVDLAVLRFFLISTHYRRGLNFTFEALEQAAAGLKRITDFLFELKTRTFPAGTTEEAGRIAAEAERGFLAGLEDDLNISPALTAVFDLVRKANTLIKDGELRAGDAAGLTDCLYRFDRVLAVLPEREARDTIEEDIRAQIEAREAARKARDFQRADAIRRELLAAGVLLEDTKDGVRWKIIKTGGGA